MPITLDSNEAARLLGVTRQTLYSYVSRGLLRAQPAHDGRGKRYLRVEVERLARRAAQGRKPKAAARETLDFGLPVLESALTLIEDGTFWYRGHDAVALSRESSLEDIAALLWACEGNGIFDAEIGMSASASASARPANPLEAAVPAFLSLASTLEGLPRDASLHDRHLRCATLLRCMAAALLGTSVSSRPMHEQCARAWHVDAAAECIRRALVLCADHELNASSFTVRCVVSTGAQLHMALLAGLAALSGPRHGAMSESVETLWDAMDSRDARTVVLDAFAARPGATTIAGFGHRLYPAGDPRVAAMLQGLPETTASMHQARSLREAMARHCGEQPNLDFALVALRRTLGLPRGSAATIFCLGRTVGWLAHALEQQAQGRLIRPRANYTGPAIPRDATPANVRVVKMRR